MRVRFRSRFFTQVAFGALGLFCGILSAQTEVPRVWVDNQGRSLTALLIELEEDHIRVRRADGREFDIPLDRLSTTDRAYVQSRAFTFYASKWPERVTVPKSAVQIKEVPGKGESGMFTYQSRMFEFSSDAKLAGSLMTEIARTFEATSTLLDELPWGLTIRPPEGKTFFECELFSTLDGYYAAGGPINSGGVYMTRDKVFRIPFQSLGLKKRGSSWFKSDQFSDNTLIHEITHQLMDEVLFVLPIWVVEGTAEYTQALPFKNGTFRVTTQERGTLKHHGLDDWDLRRSISIPSLSRLMQVTPEEWQAILQQNPNEAKHLYDHSFLLVYFFCHLDGEGGGQRFRKYMRAAHETAKKRATFLKDPRVVELPYGGVRWPSSMGMPDYMGEDVRQLNLDLLLNGRTYEELAKEIETAFAKEKMTVRVSP